MKVSPSMCVLTLFNIHAVNALYDITEIVGIELTFMPDKSKKKDNRGSEMARRARRDIHCAPNPEHSAPLPHTGFVLS
jgi:hypothetical protein